MKDEIRTLDFRKPEDCRDYLKSFTINGHPVESLSLADGTQLLINELSDEEAIHRANELFYQFNNNEGLTDTRLTTKKSQGIVRHPKMINHKIKLEWN